ncbi:hypothetical protein [Corynebacterium sp.]|uniref:hypothetical protein n=1 Tax=Corynebacterium sp. TaxID=1720 RepID=UPI0026DBCA71|nr:hypothetical protein [Corynebacterium sp.]MDO4609267.1 hypothetical protein [Corynebacterium sp.]
MNDILDRPALTPEDEASVLEDAHQLLQEALAEADDRPGAAAARVAAAAGPRPGPRPGPQPGRHAGGGRDG